MFTKRRTGIVLIIILLVVVLSISFFHLLPLNLLQVQQKPEQAPQTVYDYYLIIDEATNTTLMYVPLVVTYDDEVLTEDNKLYRVVRIEENRAYARFVKDMNLEKYNSPQKK